MGHCCWYQDVLSPQMLKTYSSSRAKNDQLIKMSHAEAATYQAR